MVCYQDYVYWRIMAQSPLLLAATMLFLVNELSNFQANGGKLCTEEGSNCYFLENITRTYKKANCPIAACGIGCWDFVVQSDGCPICRCDGYATKEPCKTTEDCPSGVHCKNNLCHYLAVSESLPLACEYSLKCATDEQCRNGACVPSHRVHLFNISCFISGECPFGFSCEDMVCMEGGAEADHIQDISCISSNPASNNCPKPYRCRNMSCVKELEPNLKNVTFTKAPSHRSHQHGKRRNSSSIRKRRPLKKTL